MTHKHMDNQQKTIWFKNKYFGWGWRPVTWQGWLIVLTYAGAIALLIIWVQNMLLNIPATDEQDIRKIIIMFFAMCAVLTATLIAVCLKFGEKPRWHWGFKDDDRKQRQ